MQYTKLWLGLIGVIVLSFAILGYYGKEIYRQAPPVPERVVTPDGVVLFTGQDIRDGQNVWQSIGGQQVGSIWVTVLMPLDRLGLWDQSPLTHLHGAPLRLRVENQLGFKMVKWI